ncbi:hypothetical protein [Streptomyces sp. NPDC001889]
MSMSVRRTRGATGNVVAWERTIDGVTYWFDATPYELKAFRLSLTGGDLVHHWRDVPDTVGEYDRYEPSTRPAPGEVAWTRHGDSRTADRRYWTACRVCDDVVEVAPDQLIARHGPGYGARACPGTGTAATLKAALVRESVFSPQEAHVRDAVGRWLMSCKGHQTLSDGSTEFCHHPVCGRRLDAGLRWTLSGWKKP